MGDGLQEFIRRLVNQAINAAIHSVFWKMPLWWTIGVLGALIAIAVIFKLY